MAIDGWNAADGLWSCGSWPGALSAVRTRQDRHVVFGTARALHGVSLGRRIQWPIDRTDLLCPAGHGWTRRVMVVIWYGPWRCGDGTRRSRPRMCEEWQCVESATGMGPMRTDPSWSRATTWRTMIIRIGRSSARSPNRDGDQGQLDQSDVAVSRPSAGRR